MSVQEQTCCELQEGQISTLTDHIRSKIGLNDRLYLDRYAKFGFKDFHIELVSELPIVVFQAGNTQNYLTFPWTNDFENRSLKICSFCEVKRS